jgi:hypothetical protein
MGSQITKLITDNKTCPLGKFRFSRYTYKGHNHIFYTMHTCLIVSNARMISFQERSINLSLIKQLFTSNDVSA